MLQRRSVSLLAKAKNQATFYFNGVKLLFAETKEAKLLEQKILHQNHSPTRNEFLFLRRNQEDVRKLVPFALIAMLVPELIPILLLRGSNVIPSTCISPSQLESKRKKFGLNRLDYAEEFVKQMERKGIDLMLDNDKALIENLPRAALSNMARHYGFPVWRTNGQLRNRLRLHAEFLRRDGQYIRQLTDLSALSIDEIKDACELRGIPTAFVDPLESLKAWIEFEQNTTSDGLLLLKSIYDCSKIEIEE